MRRITIVIIACIFSVSGSVHARQVVRPDRVPSFRSYEERELRLVQQMVDEGKQRWRTDPDSFARFFLNFYYPDLRPFERDRLNAKVYPKKGRSIVQVFYKGKAHTIYLKKVYPTYPDSIWVVDKMVID